MYSYSKENCLLKKTSSEGSSSAYWRLDLDASCFMETKTKLKFYRGPDQEAGISTGRAGGVDQLFVVYYNSQGIL